MKKIFFLLLILVALSWANRIIAKDSTPGGIYIVGPDVSPDSTDLTLLYYSPDAGTTLVLKDTLNWGAVKGIAADLIDGIVYIARRDFVSDGLWISLDSGKTWENRGDYYRSVPYSGNTAGEILIGSWIFSTDFGFSATIGERLGLPLPCDVYWRGGGTEPGESYIIDYNGILYKGWDYADTFIMIDTIGLINITVGTQPGELWAISSTNLLFSSNHGSTFVEVSSLPILFTDFIRGENWGSLFICHTHYNEIPMEGIFGGTIIICYTDNYGDEYICCSHDADGVRIEVISDIIKSKNTLNDFKLIAYPNPFNSSISIETTTPTQIEIFNISGKIVFKSDEKTINSIWEPDGLPGGVYLIKAQKNKAIKKIIYLK